MSNDNLDLTGIWYSRYEFHSSSRKQNFESTHHILLERNGDVFIGKSLPHHTGSVVSLKLSLHEDTIRGTWEEHTSPTGYYRGKVYQGTLEFSPFSSDHLKGKWLGKSKDGEINSGIWELIRQERATDTEAVMRYCQPGE